MGITIWQSLADSSETMAKTAFRGLRSLNGWKRIRPQRQREFMHDLGLDPLPERCDLAVVEHGTFSGKGFRARKIAFQLMPDCWGSAAIYYPDPMPAGKLPGVLYVCGHAEIGTWHYQYHPVMWARRGYACLIVDTTEQNDNPGEHHGSSMGRFERWLAMGYTPAGGEVWNAMRALDILESDPNVDPQRLGVTGVSGGGACSFHVAVADDRLKAVSTLCGISSPYDGIANRHVMHQCDCMFPLNIYARDISEYAALIAPRAALFCIAEHDTLYHPAESRALVDRTKRVYRLYKEEDRCQWLACPGPHGDHVEFDRGTCRWFDRYVAGKKHRMLTRGDRDLEESVTTVFNGTPPAPNRIDLLPRLLSPRGTVELPQQPGDWPAIRDKAIRALRRHVPGLVPAKPGSGSIQPDGTWYWGGGPKPIVFSGHRGSVNGVDIWLHMVIPPATRPKLLIGVGNEGETVMHALSRAACHTDTQSIIYSGFEPRMAGFNAPDRSPVIFPPGSRYAPVRTTLLRAMALTGMTPVMMTIQDIGLLVTYLRRLKQTRNHEIYLYGKQDAGVAALYYALLDERIGGVVAEDIPSSHLDGAAILGVLRTFDIPQAVGLMAPRKVALVAPGHSFWTWPTRVYKRLDCPEHLVMTDDLHHALERVLV